MKMSVGDVDVAPYLDSQNTKGYGIHNSKSQGPKYGKIVIGGSGEDFGVCGFGRCGGMWGCGGDRTVKVQFRQGFTDVRAFTVVRTLSDVRPFPVVRSLGENRAREEEL